METKVRRLLDKFYHSLIGGDKQYEDVWNVMKICFIISHGNASVEGGFSINKSLLVENLTQESLIAQRTIYDYLKTIDGPQNHITSNSLLVCVRSARKKYYACLEKKKENESKEQQKQAEKRKIEKKIQEVEEKKKKLELQREKENIELQTLKNALEEKRRKID